MKCATAMNETEPMKTEPKPDQTGYLPEGRGSSNGFFNTLEDAVRGYIESGWDPAFTDTKFLIEATRWPILVRQFQRAQKYDSGEVILVTKADAKEMLL